MRRLHTIEAIKHAVANGYDVRCDGGGYKVIRDSIGQFLITHVDTNYCVGLHGAENTQYATKLNGRDFYVKPSATPVLDAIDKLTELQQFEKLDPDCADVPEWMTRPCGGGHHSGYMRELSDDYGDVSGECSTLCVELDHAADRLDRAHLDYLKAKRSLSDLVEAVNDALGCTDGDDIREHLAPVLKAVQS